MSQDPRYLAESRPTYLQLMEHRSPGAARGTKRDQAPLPEAARQVIHEQIRSGSAVEAATVRHTRKRARTEQPSPLLAAVGHASQQTALSAAPGHASATLGPRVPTCQEMYNTWRALGEQVNKISRLPAFIKSSRLLCHRCRILKLQCNCYDYSQLETAYQEEDRGLRQAALHQIPASDALLLLGASASASASPAVQYPLVSAAYGDSSSGDGETSVGPRLVRQRQLATPSPLTSAASASAFALAATTSRPPPPPAEPPRLLQYEIREVVLARERIGTHTRLWCCQYSTESSASSASSRVHVCAREDENMATIRRHYSREHGSHRYHSPPALRTYCSSCSYVVPDGVAGAPHQCPGCGASDGRLWLRVLYALVEVPVPLAGNGTDSAHKDKDGGSSTDAGPDVDANTGGTTATEDPYAVSAPPAMPMLLQPPAALSLPQLHTPISPEAPFYWMAYSMPPTMAYPLAPGGRGGGGGGGGGGMTPHTPMTPGFPSAPTTTMTAPAPYPSLAETDVFSNAWGLQPQAEAQQQQQQQQQRRPDAFLDGGGGGLHYQ